jgi:ATP-binding cassette subfamily B protein
MATIGTAFLILYYVNILVGPLQEVRSQIDDLQRATASIVRIQELFQIQPSIVDSLVLHLPLGKLSVVFDRVWFGYQDGMNGNDNGNRNDGRENVLEEISFHLQPGKVLGILGRTGSGKTTLTRLLYRLYDPLKGKICLDDVDIQEVSLGELRKRVGVVTQDVQLFQASLRDNVTLFNRLMSDEQIEEVIYELGLWEWYQKLPAGLSSPLSAKGVGLSAGEAQLLAFTRVFLRDPGLVILDEASSRLDPATEDLLEGAIERLLYNRTGLIIAHRLKTVQRADEIIILEKGRIREIGDRLKLAADPDSTYCHLLQTGLEEALV